MQARYTSFILSAAIAQAAFAQSPALSVAANMPSAGQDVQVWRLPTATPTPAGGQGGTHDFSALTGGQPASYKWLAASTLPSPHAPATLALTDGGSDTVYYRNNGGLERVAERQALVGQYIVDANYSDGPLELKMPLAYGDTWNDAISATFQVDGNSAVRTGTISGEADASGWVTLPGGGAPIEVLRVRTYVNENIVVTVSILTITITHKRHVDSYYGAWSKFPVFRTYADSLWSSLGNQFFAGTEWLQQTSLGVASTAPVDLGVGLAPNPANGPVDLSWTADGSPTTLEVFSTTGALVLKRDLGTRGSGAQRTRIDTDGWMPGLYLVRLRDAGRSVVKRLTVR
ncbi:MAG: T9SS type A sorting domain-containing protein [Flavobacteriales bacterium]